MGPLFYFSPGAWGPGLDRPLHGFEFDGNNWTIQQAIVALEAGVAAISTRGIESVTDGGGSFLITYTDATTDTVPIPQPDLNLSGPYQPAFDYTNELFTAQGALWRVLIAHTSAPEFDPGANAGPGLDYYDYYEKVLSFPSIPVVARAGSTLTVATSDINTYNRCTNVGGCAITIPDAEFEADAEIHFRQCANGGLTIAGENANVLIEPPYSLSAATSVKGAVVTLKYCGVIGGVKTWDLFGLLRGGGVGLAGLFTDPDTFHAPTVS